MLSLNSLPLALELSAIFFSLIFTSYWMMNKLADDHSAFVAGTTIAKKSSGFLVGLVIFTAAKLILLDPLLSACMPVDLGHAAAANITGLAYFALGLGAIHSASGMIKGGLKPITATALLCFCGFAIVVVFARLISHI